MNVQDLLKTPQLFAVKKDGVLQVTEGLAGDKIALMTVWLFSNHGVVGCGNPDCDCLDQAWADHADGATIVSVTVVELEGDGATIPINPEKQKQCAPCNQGRDRPDRGEFSEYGRGRLTAGTALLLWAVVGAAIWLGVGVALWVAL